MTKKITSGERRLREMLTKSSEPPDIPDDKIPYHQKYSTGYEQGMYISEEEHKDLIYKLVKKLVA